MTIDRKEFDKDRENSTKNVKCHSSAIAIEKNEDSTELKLVLVAMADLGAFLLI